MYFFVDSLIGCSQNLRSRNNWDVAAIIADLRKTKYWPGTRMCKGSVQSDITDVLEGGKSSGVEKLRVVPIDIRENFLGKKMKKILQTTVICISSLGIVAGCTTVYVPGAPIEMIPISAIGISLGRVLVSSLLGIF